MKGTHSQFFQLFKIFKKSRKKENNSQYNDQKFQNPLTFVSTCRKYLELKTSHKSNCKTWSGFSRSRLELD
jgi:hypothetical protein